MSLPIHLEDYLLPDSQTMSEIFSDEEIFMHPRKHAVPSLEDGQDLEIAFTQRTT